jgi:hypothetical protein
MKRILLAAAFAVTAITPAWATVEFAHVRTMGLGYELIDLNKSDGIVPAISFYDTVALQSYNIRQSGLPALEEYRSGYGTLELSARGAHVEALGAPDLKESYASSSADVVATSKSGSFTRFDLAPWTKVVFHLPYAVEANVVLPGSWVIAEVGMSARLGDWNDSRHFSTGGGLRSNGTQSGSLSGELYTDSSSLSGFLSFDAYSAVSVVPEPATYAMLLAGLGVLAAARRRINAA